MLYEDNIKVIFKKSEGGGFDPDTGEYIESEEESKLYKGNIVTVNDIIDSKPEGLFTGKTIQAVFMQPIPKFKHIEYEGKKYRPVSYEGTRKRVMIVLEEVL